MQHLGSAERHTLTNPNVLQPEFSAAWQGQGTRGSSAKAVSTVLTRNYPPNMQANNNSKLLDRSFVALLVLDLLGKWSRIAVITCLDLTKSCLQIGCPKDPRSMLSVFLSLWGFTSTSHISRERARAQVSTGDGRKEWEIHGGSENSWRHRFAAWWCILWDKKFWHLVLMPGNFYALCTNKLDETQ